MEKSRYVTVKVNYEFQKIANSKKLSVNQYIEFLKSLADRNATVESESVLNRLNSFESIAKNLNETVGHQRYMIDVQNKKIDSLIDTQQKLINAYAADIEFINELKKMVLEEK